MLRTISLFVILYIMWLLLSGHQEPLMLILGLFSVAVVTLVSARMKVIDREGHPMDLSWRILSYWPWLIYTIVRSNIDVARIILSPRMRISPTVTSLPCHLQTGLGQATYANSITLTPGTVCLKIDDSHVEIHALTKDMANDLKSGLMEQRVRLFADRS